MKGDHLVGKYYVEFDKHYKAQIKELVAAGQSVPHVNPGELFVFLGVANGITQLGLSTVDLALRYFLIGILINFIGGVITDFTTAYVSKQQGVVLSDKVKTTH